MHSQRDFSDKAGISEVVISRALKGGEKVLSDKFMQRMNKEIGDIFAYNWLLMGKGIVFVRIDNNGETIRTLPFVPIEAMAGTLTEDTDGVTLDKCEQYKVPDFIDAGAQFLIRVSGDSMTPHYNNGDIVAVRKVEDAQFFQWGKIYVLDTNQGAIIKRIYEDKRDNRNIICHSENDDVYDDFTMPKDAVRGLFVIVGVIHTE